jgi:site-specific recombinase XerD
VDDLREEFLASCRAKNLSERTVEWYEEKSRRFAEWCLQDGASDVASLTASHLDAFLTQIKLRGSVAGRAVETGIADHPKSKASGM